MTTRRLTKDQITQVLRHLLERERRRFPDWDISIALRTGANERGLIEAVVTRSKPSK